MPKMQYAHARKLTPPHKKSRSVPVAECTAGYKHATIFRQNGISGLERKGGGGGGGGQGGRDIGVNWG